MDGNEVYFYLLELQSTVDFQMPYRLLCYMVEIWRSVLKDTDRKEAARKASSFQLLSLVYYTMELIIGLQSGAFVKRWQDMRNLMSLYLISNIFCLMSDDIRMRIS